MIRRSRISVRPNVRPGNRSTASSQDASQKNQDSSSQPSVDSVQTEPAPEQLEASTTPTEKPEAAASCQDEVSQSKKPVLGRQWRKNTSQPNISLSKPRNLTAITDMKHDESTSQSPSPQKCTLSSQKTAVSVQPNLPRVAINKDETTPSTASVQVKADCKAPQRSKARQSSTALPRQCKVKGREDNHAQQQPDMIHLNKENTDIPESNTEQASRPLKVTTSQEDPVLNTDSSKASENSQRTSSPEQDTLTSEKVENRPSRKGSFSVRQGLNDPADRIRLGKAQKLQELLRKEMNKERCQNFMEKMKRMQYDTLKDHSKMTMRELIYYLPKTNPMKSHQEKEQNPNETIISSVPSQAPEEMPAQPDHCVGGQEQPHDEDAADLSDSDTNEPMLVPQVKVAEDGSLIIDEESLTVEVLRSKGPNITEDRDPIFERGSTTTYSSFRKGCYTKPWSSQETDMFFLAISMVGTDFSMIDSMFPHRARSEIKNKFKKEERANGWRIDKAFREKRRLDLDFFTELLNKILADEERRKMNRGRTSTGAKLTQRRNKKKTRVRKPLKPASDIENSTEEDPIDDFTEGEKENEDYMNEHEKSDGKKRRKSGEGCDLNPVTDTLDTGIESPGRPAPGESSHSDGKDSEMQCTPLACERQQRFPRRTSRKTGQSTISGDSSPDETKEEASSQTRKRSKASETSKARKRKREVVEVNEESSSKSTRLKRAQKRNRVPKESKEDTSSNSSPPKRKKGTGLVTIRATDSEDDTEAQDVQEPGSPQDCYPTNPEDQSQVPAFVPLGLRSPSLERAVVEEAVQEDVIDFIAPENLEASEESYKEAAQTLLTIGNSAHMSQISASDSADPEQTDEHLTGVDIDEHLTGVDIDSGRPDVSSEPETSIHGVPYTERNEVEDPTDVSQLEDANCEEPIFIISLTEISPSFIETLPSDTDPPLSHSELLLCNPEPLPSLTDSLTSETHPCTTGTISMNAESLPTFTDSGSSPHEPLASLTEPYTMATDIVPSLNETLTSITDNLSTVTEPLTSIIKSSPVTTQLSTAQEEEQGSPPPGHSADLLVTDDLMLKEEEEEGNKNKQLECITDLSPGNLTLETSATQPGKTEVQSDLPSRRIPAKRIRAKTTPVSQICKTDQPSCTKSTGSLMATSSVILPDSRVEETHKGSEGVTAATLEEIGSLHGIAAEVPIAMNSSDELPTATGMVSHLLIPNALVAVSEEEEEGGEEEVKSDELNHEEDATSQVTFPCSTPPHPIDKTDQSSAPSPTTSPSVHCSTADHHNDSKDNSEQELSSEDLAKHPSISQWETPQDDTAVSHIIVPDALVPVSEEMEKKHESKQGKSTKRIKCDNLDTASSSHENVSRSSERLDSDGLVEEMSPPKKRKLLEGTRRAKLQVKPALPVRRISSQNASGEKSTPPVSSTQSSSTSQSECGQTRSKQLPESLCKSSSAVNAVVGEESSVVQPSTPPVTNQGAIRPGRKPKGFLSFMSSNKVSGTTTTRPPLVKSAQSRTMRSAPRIISPETEPATPSTSSTNSSLTRNRTTSDTGSAELIASSCAEAKNPEMKSCESTQSYIKHHSEEPTNVSEYFLSNIFTEVEEQE